MSEEAGFGVPVTIGEEVAKAWQRWQEGGWPQPSLRGVMAEGDKAALQARNEVRRLAAIKALGTRWVGLAAPRKFDIVEIPQWLKKTL